MCAEELPDTLLGALPKGKARLQPVVRLVGRDDEILLDGGTRDLSVGALLLVHRAHVSNDETGREHGFLDRRPDGVLGVVEDDRDPAARL